MEENSLRSTVIRNDSKTAIEKVSKWDVSLGRSATTKSTEPEKYLQQRSRGKKRSGEVNILWLANGLKDVGIGLKLVRRTSRNQGDFDMGGTQQADIGSRNESGEAEDGSFGFEGRRRVCARGLCQKLGLGGFRTLEEPKRPPGCDKVDEGSRYTDGFSKKKKGGGSLNRVHMNGRDKVRYGIAVGYYWGKPSTGAAIRP